MAERLFLAVRPDAATAQRIESLAQELRRKHGLRGKSLGPERFHVTLHLIGDFAGGVPAQVLAGALDAASPVAARTSPFPIGLGTVASFTRKRRNMPLVLLAEEGGQGLGQLQQELVAALAAVDLAGRIEPRFTPHLTLLYDDRPLAAQAVEPLSWRASELLLVRSLLGRSRHEVLARLPLGA
ncbi:MAG: 2'-5' RNA ligase family protein [Proteobacteria bacterium]|nr:2'-5' RNA ligase family protein [Pseudomonadota bacterium]